MSDVFIVDAVRTPIGRGKDDGAHHQVHPVDLLAQTLNALIERAGIDKSQVEDIVAGCVTATGEQGSCIGRMAGLKARFPNEVPAVQLNRFCGFRGAGDRGGRYRYGHRLRRRIHEPRPNGQRQRSH
jgi:acetyl-CoA acyltransferase